MSNAADIQDRIEAGLIRVAMKTGAGRYYACLEKPGPAGGTAGNPTPGTPTKSTLTVVQDNQQARDASGPINKVIRKLLVSAKDAEPVKGDRVAVGYIATDTIPDAAWIIIDEVVTTAPAGTAFLYEVLLSS